MSWTEQPSWILFQYHIWSATSALNNSTLETLLRLLETTMRLSPSCQSCYSSRTGVFCCISLKCISRRLQRAQLGDGFVETATEAYEQVVALVAALHKAEFSTLSTRLYASRDKRVDHISRWAAEEFDRLHGNSHQPENRIKMVARQLQRYLSREPYSEDFLRMIAYTHLLVKEAWSFELDQGRFHVPEDTVRWAEEVHGQNAAEAPFGTLPDGVTDDARTGEQLGKQFLHSVAFFVLIMHHAKGVAPAAFIYPGIEPVEAIRVQLQNYVLPEFRYGPPRVFEFDQ